MIIDSIRLQTNAKKRASRNGHPDIIQIFSCNCTNNGGYSILCNRDIAAPKRVSLIPPLVEEIELFSKTLTTT